ncbi:hypothetical protein C8F01DRAFT_1133353 [Mycena amicta]|nr:hypothetical protein C8F01DRAFT_1133353 [Mycena amicta]
MTLLSVSLGLFCLFAPASSAYAPLPPLHFKDLGSHQQHGYGHPKGTGFNGTIRWVDCHERVPAIVQANVNITSDTPLPSSLQCGEIDVPMDYSKPFDSQKNKITVGFAMNRPQKPEGVIFYHAGGPGENAILVAWENALNVTNEFTDLLDTLEFLAINTRGIEFSNPLNCKTGAFFNDVDYAFPTSDKQYKAYISAMDNFIKSCANTEPAGFIQHVGTREVIQDWDVLRAALGYERIHFMGVSYGTFVSAAYVARFPEHVGHFVIDAVIPHGDNFQDMITHQMAAINRLLYRADAFCLNDTSCPFYGQGKGSVVKAFDTLLKQATKQPLAAPSCGPGTLCKAPVTATDLRFGVHATFRSDPDFPLFNLALSQALAGNASLFGYIPSQDVRETVVSPLLCSDFVVKDEWKTFEAFNNFMVNARSVDTHSIHYAQTWQLLLQCSTWPYKVPPQPTLPNNLPIMWVTSDFDLNLPTELTTFAWEQTPNATLVIRHGDNHASIQLVDGDAGTASALARNFVKTGVMPKAQNDSRVTVIPPGGKRGPVPNPYDAPTGAAAGDTSLIENIA